MKLLSFIYLLLFAKSSFAYLDPGSFSLILQGLVAGIAAFFGLIVSFWDKIRKFLKKILKK